VPLISPKTRIAQQKAPGDSPEGQRL
jgi:hypothetical protein